MVQLNLKAQAKSQAISCTIYAESESVLKRIQSDDTNNNTSYTKTCQEHIPCSFAYKVICIDDRISKAVVLHRAKNAVNKFIEAILKMIIAKNNKIAV